MPKTSRGDNSENGMSINTPEAEELNKDENNHIPEIPVIMLEKVVLNESDEETVEKIAKDFEAVSGISPGKMVLVVYLANLKAEENRTTTHSPHKHAHAPPR